VSHTTTPVAPPALVRLDWECEHFGLHAAQLASPDLTDAALAAALRLARHQGVQWIVWPAPGGREVPAELLEEFAGTLADRKATFSRSLSPAAVAADSSAKSSHRIRPYAEAGTSAELYELAISSGAYSRFKADVHLSDERFEAMYRRWIERSVSGEMADAVLVALGAEQERLAGTAMAGMVTLSESSGVGSIGLIAVAAAFRGRGIATALMQAAHRWMHDRGATEARVVTQLANLPACRLYERSGYRRSQLQHYYHFWPQVPTRDR